MKYLIDLTALSSRNTGIEYVAENAALSFIKCCRNESFILLFNYFIPDVFKRMDSSNVIKIVDLKINSWRKLRYFGLPKAIKSEKADYNLFFAFPCPYFAPHKNSISLIHDLTPFKYKDTQEFLQNIQWRALIRKAIRKNKYILTVSDIVKYEIANYFSRGDCKRIYPGVKNPSHSIDNNIFKKCKIEKGKYILSVGTFEPRKNYKLLIDAFNELDNEKLIDCKLVLVGKSGWKFDCECMSKNIIMMDYQNEEALSALYENAKLYVCSSVYEGFGLPVIEAAKHKTNILISDIPVFRETTSNCASYFNCCDKDDLKDKIKIMLKSNNSIQKIDCSKFSWDFYGKELSNFILNDSKYLCLCTNNLQSNNGYKKRVLQYYSGLQANHHIDKYVGNSKVNFSVMNLFDVFHALCYKQCAIRNKDVKYLIRLLKTEQYTHLFIDNSLYGNLYNKLRKKFPTLKIITHFHNCEYKYYSDLYLYYGKTKKNLMSSLSLRMIKKSEFYACKYSNQLIFISKEDKEQFKDFNIRSQIVPVCISDDYIKKPNLNDNSDYVMFVGSNFYANIEAINFLINKVAPYVNKKIIIVGDELVGRHNDAKNIYFVRYSNNIEKIFLNSLAFVSPIFSGSGSKIKIAEALMWGKKIIATQDSLFGYDYANMDVKICKSADDFIKEINSIGIKDKFSSVNRELFLNNHSYRANLRYFKKI